jgi:hypothetical protein
MWTHITYPYFLLMVPLLVYTTMLFLEFNRSIWLGTCSHVPYLCNYYAKMKFNCISYMVNQLIRVIHGIGIGSMLLHLDLFALFMYGGYIMFNICLLLV